MPSTWEWDENRASSSQRGFCLHKISSLYQFMNEFLRLHEFLILRKKLGGSKKFNNRKFSMLRERKYGKYLVNFMIGLISVEWEGERVVETFCA